MSRASVAARCADRLRAPLADLQLAHKSWTPIWRAVDDDGRRYAVKMGVGARAEARMLRLLSQKGGLPTPEIFGEDDDLLIMAWLDGGPPCGNADQIACADALAAAHDATAPRFGLDFTTPIGPFAQDNAPNADWVAFFRDQRLRPQAEAAAREGAIDAAALARFERLASQLDGLLEPPPRPSLLHGDLWAGNLLVNDGALIGVIDPASYFGHFEIELAFGGLFATFDGVFLDRYQDRRNLDRAWRTGFERTRRDLYNLFPLLVHARLFGGGYADRALAIAGRHVS
ncbi:MAG: fructosamine kinase family protein [Pseudomonadota bacterium]